MNATPSKSPVGRHLLHDLQEGDVAKGDFPLTRIGAALFVSHMLVELGEKAVAAMKGIDARAYTAKYIKTRPMLSSGLQVGHIQKFVRVLAMYGVSVEDPEHYRAEMARLDPPANAAVFPPQPPPAKTVAA